MANTVLRLDKENPYSNGKIIQYDDGTMKLERKEWNYKPSVRDKYHIVIEGETLSQISYLYYGTSKYWWAIKDVNPQMEDIFELEFGVAIIIPDLINLMAAN